MKSFLLDKQLDVLVPAMKGMSGQLLHQLYTMHQTNQQVMFLSLRDDVAKSGHENLTLKDYLTFLREIKVYIPHTNDSQPNSPSVICDLM